MVRIVKKKFDGYKVVLGEKQNRGLVFLTDKRGGVKKAYITEEAKGLGIVKATPRKKKNNMMFPDFKLI